MSYSAKGGAKTYEINLTVDDVATDPDTMSVYIYAPDGTTSTADLADIEKVSTGVYRYTITPLTDDGNYRFRVVATFGEVTQATIDDRFVVKDTVFD